MDLQTNGGGAPNGGVVDAEEKMMMRKKAEMARHGDSVASHQQEEDEGLVSSLLTKLDAQEKDADLHNGEPNSFHPNHQHLGKDQTSKEVELADIAKDLNKIKRQNTITHVLLGTVIIMTAVWQVNEMSFLLWVQKKMSNPFKSLGDLIKGSLKMKGRKPVIETSPLPPVGIPDVTRADLPTLVISGDHR
ncbi:hypothetical protein EJB05_21570 [Eragrostis curvula]|uniref:Uncharacterized protein n=1 Tax=Eragrostis curvula TaxID=38414 RepID=A0A5J9V3M7_9POAL|nr:hypothetical protein EJB05_21570 [Eragrostis curvula]